MQLRKALLRGCLGTLCRQRWSGALEKTGHGSGKTNGSHLFLAPPPPQPPGHWPQNRLSILSHQGLQGRKQSKELAEVQYPPAPVCGSGPRWT